MEYLQYVSKCNSATSPPAVLNLIINGIPSIQNENIFELTEDISFKPYYKWNTFNTEEIIGSKLAILSFKPYYKWNTFNTIKKLWRY